MPNRRWMEPDGSRVDFHAEKHFDQIFTGGVAIALWSGFFSRGFYFISGAKGEVNYFIWLDCMRFFSNICELRTFLEYNFVWSTHDLLCPSRRLEAPTPYFCSISVFFSFSKILKTDVSCICMTFNEIKVKVKLIEAKWSPMK